MRSKSPSPSAEEENGGSSDVPIARGKTKGKVPKRAHKAEREKLKREHLNELFLDLANALELEENTGKAAILTQAARILKELFGQIETLEKDNHTLLSESNYATGEKNELEEEKHALETQIQELRSEIKTKVAQFKPDLNAPPPNFQQSETSSSLQAEQLSFPVGAASVQQPPALLIVPVSPNIQAYQVQDSAINPNSLITKPHARYPTASDSWPSQLLSDRDTVRNEHGLGCSDHGLTSN